MMVQMPDGAYRLRADVLKAEFKRGGALHDLLLRYTQGLLLHTAQIAACNRVHHVEERLARWLLMSRDRCVCDELPLTQEFLSLMLGVRRAGVTEAALTLQTEGYINYTRGHITIIDREGLESASCGCYEIIKAEFDRLIA
jgi:CRP-like cAMP-binding protein